MNAAPLSALPPLRQELEIHPAQNTADGAPAWTLHDPVDNRFFEIGWPAFEILSRWHLSDPATLLEAIARETTLTLGLKDIENLLGFLHQHCLLLARSATDTARLTRLAAARRLSVPMWLLKHYLFIRIPLVHPMAFLRALLPWVAWLYDPRVGVLMAGLAVLGLCLVSLQWDSFLHTFSAYTSWQGMLGVGLALGTAKVVHELGHALTACRHGCRVPNMGVAFLVMVPVLYTDTNEAWKLPSRRARLQIGAAGMAAELGLAAYATLLWSFLPEGALRAGVFLLATSTWLVTLTINLSPFMRFDGYFLLSDWLSLPNLHDRAFALGRWHLRQILFGWHDEAPEYFPPARRRFLIAFAYLTWLYRFSLFLGIALLVYHLFFKILGILLLAVEVGWFVALPIQREFALWWQSRGRMRWNKATRRTLGLLGLAAIILLVPWPRGIQAPAVLEAAQVQWLYTPAAGQVLAVSVQPGQQVTPSQRLLQLRSPDLQFRINLVQARERRLAWQLEQQSLDPRLQEHGATLRQGWEAAREELAGLRALDAQLQVHAAFAGQVANFNPANQPGAWIARGEPLIQIVGPQGVKIEAYVEEAELPQIALDAPARFIADEAGVPEVTCRVRSLDRMAASTLDHPALGSPFGGPIAASADSHNRVLPRDAWFRVLLDRCEGVAHLTRERFGIAVIGHARNSYAVEWGRQILSALHREAGW